MMNAKRILCLIFSLVMLLGMTVSASSEITGDINCYHQWTWSWPQGKPANCQDWKPSQEYCEKCGALGGYYDQCGPCVPGSKTWIRPQATNCMEFGVWEIACKYCGEWLEGSEEPGPHKWNTQIRREPTCEMPGYKENICVHCGSEQGDPEEIPALGHKWGSWNWAHEKPSCNEGGWQVRNCERCGRMEDRWVEGTNHKFGEWQVDREPTCTFFGLKYIRCSVCKKTEFGSIPELGHSFGEWQIIKQPTANEDGLKERKCIRCDQTEQEPIPYTGYAFASLNKKEASSPANGKFYTLGETVLYSVVFTVPEGLTLHDVEITDPIKGNNEDAVLDILPEADGGEYTYSVSHVVTETDIENGFVSNIATAYFFDPEGDAWVSVSSNEVTVLTGEDDNSAVILEKIDMRGPANGEYYVPGEAIKYGLTVRSDENNPLENIVIYDPLKGGDQIVFGPADSWVLGAGFDYTVTEADAQRGYIENTGYATFTYQNTGKEDTVYSNTLILPCGTAEASYITAIDLELVGLPDAENVKPGDVLKVKLKATNTGETTVTMNSSGRVAANGDWFDDAGIMNWNKYQSDPLSDWFMAGNSLTSDLDITVTESHIADGEIRFTFIQYAEPIYVVVNGVETDIPADIVPTPEGTTGRYGKDEEEVSDSVEIVIPLTNGSDDQKNSNFTKHVSNTPANGEFFVPGEEIRFWLSFNILDSEGNINEEDGVYDIRFYDPLIHGQNIVRWDTKRIYSWDFHVYYTVTEEDAQRGYVENTAYVTFSYTEGGETVRLDSNTVTAPCGPGELPDDYQDPGSVMLTLIEWSEPDNGTHYVPGEKINVYHRISNNSRDVTMTMDHQHFFEICGDGIKEKDDSLYSKVLLPGTSYGVYFWGPTVTEADAARGYVERTTTFYLMGDDGNEYTATGSVRLPCGPGELPDDYVPPVDPDIDGDGIPNEEDPDIDGDGIPNGEDPDVDGDGIPNGSDPDADGDGIPNGDDPDADGDGTPNESNPDVDGDGIPNGNDPDADGDGIPNGDDTDADGDGIPNGDDPDADGDGIPNGSDPDADGDGIPNGDDPDIDGDGIPNDEDPDMDGDGVPNEDDPDMDGDGITDEDGDFGLSDGLTLVKTLLSTPANGNYFVPGEEVEYSLLVKNTGDALKGLVVSDWMWDAPRSFGEIQKGEDVTYRVKHTVTDADARAQHVNNIAQAEAVDMNGNGVFEYSNLVSVPCGFPDLDGDGNGNDPFGILSGLEVTKTVESLPLNGAYYTEGETVAYRITYTNVGEIPLTDVEIFDPLFGLGGMASAEMLTPGESRYCYFDYIITVEDVARGYVYNQAMAVYTINDITFTAYSNSVIVDTDGNTDNNPSFDWIYGVLIPPTDGEPDADNVDLEKLRASGVCCARAITYKDGASAAYEIAFCPKHLGATVSTSMMMRAAVTPEMLVQAATYKTAIFRSEVEKLYQELVDACDPKAKALVVSEYISFQTEIANYEQILKLANPEKPEQAAVRIAELWEEKCVTMCIEIHTAASDRKDSLLDIKPVAGSGKSTCVCETVSEENGKKTYQQSYCPVHAFPFSMIDALLMGNDTAEAWNMVRQIWTVELDSVYSKVSEKLGANKVLAMADYQAWIQWMAAREACLTAIYPSQPQIVCQTMAKMVIDRVNDLCGLIK